jgi:LAGLIDADG endonuclease
MEIFEFKQWFVGITDGYGSFDINIQENSCNFVFKINISISNIQLLYYIKKNLKFGSVVKDNKKQRAIYQISDQRVLKKVVLPIFDRYNLLTIKFFEYCRFKKSIEIADNKDYSVSKKNLLIYNIINQPPIDSIFSPIWLNNFKELQEFESINSKPHMEQILHEMKKEKDVNKIYKLVKLYKLDSLVTKYWLIGFIETQGDFSLIYNNQKNIVHRFTLIQERDILILAVIKSKFHISSQIKYNSKDNYFILDTTNSRAIENIIKFFSGKNRNRTSMKGIKGLEFRIWQRSYVKYRGNTEKLIKIRDLLQKLREKFKE